MRQSGLHLDDNRDVSEARVFFLSLCDILVLSFMQCYFVAIVVATLCSGIELPAFICYLRCSFQ